MRYGNEEKEMNFIEKFFNRYARQEPQMLNAIIGLFKENAYTEISTIAQIMNAILQTFAKEKFVNGESDRDAAIDAMCQLLQSHKSNKS